MFDWLRSRLGPHRRGGADLLQQAGDALRSGAPERAREICLGVLSRFPDDAHALSLMANIAADQGQVEEGLRWAKRAVAADPAFASAYYALARSCELAAEVDRAEAAYRRVIELDPGHARAHNNLGRILSYRERRDEALACFRRALELDPQQPEANQNYAALAGEAASFDRAIRGYLDQIGKDPTDARAHNNLANTYAGLGRYDEAIAHLERAIALEPNRAEAHYSRAVMLLSEGRYREGWAEYQWRWRLDNQLAAPAHRFAQPIWNGRDLGKGALFLHGEFALGESIQFARYARLAAERCGSVVIECAPRVKCVIERIEGIDRVTTPETPSPEFAAHAPLFALPHIFGTTLETIPWSGPYVRPDPERSAYCKSMMRTAEGRGIKVGLSWSGDPKNPYNRDRSIALAALAPLLDVPGVLFYSLQKGSTESAGLPNPARLVDLTAHERDLLDTVAFIGELDLVITVDTMISALAGAMGAPVWLLLNRIPDWRHHLERRDNPWYPGMRLYRQAHGGDWAPVVAELAVDLQKRATRGG